MRIYFHATLRPITGGRTIAAPVPPGSTISALLAELIQRYPGLGPLLMDEAGQLLRQVHVMVNGRDVRYLARGLETPLDSEDALDLFPAVGGGSGADG